jgi:uncharacterized protein
MSSVMMLVGLTVVVIVIVIGASLWGLAVKSQTPKNVLPDQVPAVPYEHIRFPSGRTELKGWWIPEAKKGSAGRLSPVIIIVHGWGSNKSRMERYVSELHQEGYALLLFDVRGHGESGNDEALSVKTFRDDIAAAVHFVKTRTDIDSDRIGILGHSFGGFGSILANRDEIGIKALVTDSIPVQFSTIMKASLRKYKLPYWPFGPILAKIMFIRADISNQELKKLDALQALKNRKAPVLMVHSKQDDYVPVSELEYILQHEQVEHLYVYSSGHRSSQTDRRFWPEVLSFFAKHLKTVK